MAQLGRCVKIIKASKQSTGHNIAVFYPKFLTGKYVQKRCMSQTSFKHVYLLNSSENHNVYYWSTSDNHSYASTLKMNSGFCIQNRRFYWNTGENKQSHKKRDGKRYGILGAVIIGGVTLLGSTLLAKEKEDERSSICSASQTEGPRELDEKVSLKRTIELSRDLVQRIKDETGSPGLEVAVSVDGKPVWAEGLGYSDVENRLPCKPETILRIASISKPITMAAVARLWEKGDLDLDKPVQHYVPEFPEKTWKGEKVVLTTRQLLSHLGGIRHYDKDYIKKQEGKQLDNQKSKSNHQSNSSTAKTDQSEGSNSKKKNEMELKEYYITEKYDSVIDSLNLFKEDPLVHKPGSEFCYTTHGWTLISAVVEKAAKVKFEKYLQDMLAELGMTNTYLEENDKLIYNRGRHYVKNKRGRLVNAPYTDLSYKWAGGGLISNVVDINTFGNAMLYSHQAEHSSTNLPGFLKPETMKELWTTKVSGTKLIYGGIGEIGYGLGWEVVNYKQKYGCGRQTQCFVSHTGGAVGGSSVLLILPSHDEEYSGKADGSHKPPRGVVVSIIVNMTGVGLIKTAFDIAKAFDSVDRKDMFDS